ncbi:MAG: DUF4407 domain-containing protein [Myxococcales bacterium]|nr:DUF4407 domain-containing protein [Myxococcales bacterium]
MSPPITARHPAAEPHRTLEVVGNLPEADIAGDHVPGGDFVREDAPGTVRPHARWQPAPWRDLYGPTWLQPVIRLLLLDEHGPMPRTVQAQVGFAAMLMFVQFCLDMLAWVLGFRWVFVNAMGPPGWILAVLFAGLVSMIILIFERFVITADVKAQKLPLIFNPAIMMRILVVVLFASVTAIPVEMLTFHDVIQGRLSGEVQGVREAARQQLRGDYKKDLEDVAKEEGESRKRVKEEAPAVSVEALATPELDKKLKDLTTQLDTTATDLREEAKGWRSGVPGEGRRWLRLKDQKESFERQIVDTKALRLEEIERRTDANRKAHGAATETHFEELSRISARYEARRREIEKKLRDVDRMTDDDLKLATKRDFRVADGFARRWKLMNDLEKEDPIFETTKWAVRVLFVAFGLLVLTTKALFNRPTRAYYAGRDPLDPAEAWNE